jgi:hypothetical protein
MTAPDAPRCPYCGSEVVTAKLSSGTGKRWSVCSDRYTCGATGPFRDTEDEAIAAFCGKGER